MATKHTLTITEFATLAGIPHLKNVRPYVVTNLPADEALIDTTTNEIMAGGESIKLVNGSGSISLPATDATDLNVVANTVQYEVRAEYVDPATRGRKTWRSGYFALTADANLADVATDASPMVVTVASQYAQEAKDARDGAVAIAGPVDATVAGLVQNTGGIGPLTQGALTSTYGRRVTFNVANYGAVGDGVADDTAAINAASAAAMAAGHRGVVEFGQGVFLYNGSWSLNTRSFSIRGVPGGKVNDSGPMRGTVIRAINQTGPVIDFTGYRWPGDYMGRVVFENLVIEGDGTTGAAKSGMGNNSGFIIGASFRNISIRNTGGPGVDFQRPYLNEFTNIVVETPIDPQGDQVPYFRLRNSNGNHWNGCGARSIRTTNDCWSGGAFKVTDNGTYPTEADRWIGCWAEYLHMPTNGTLFELAGNGCTIESFNSWDCAKEAGATGTSVIRLVDQAVSNFGGNRILGTIEGKESATQEWGVDVRQSNNLIQGVKGFNGNNVRLAAGVNDTVAILGGRRSAATNAAFVDESGTATNTLIDHTTGVSRYRTYQQRGKSSGSGGAGFQVEDAAATGSGAVWLGDQGARVQGVNTSLYMTGNAIFLRNTSLAGTPLYLGNSTTAPRVQSGTGSPEGVVTGVVGSIWTRTDGGAGTTLYIKESGSGSTGWVAK